MSAGRGNDGPSKEDVLKALRRCWQPVALVEELRSGPQRTVLLGEELVVFLTESGEPKVLEDRCPHRGAALSLGKVIGEGIQCPYHGWEWSGDGRCLRIPSLAEQDQIPRQAQARAHRTRVQWGIVWTVLDQPLGEPPSVPWFDQREWQWGHGEPFELPVSLGVMLENFRDVAHFAFVHRATLGAMPEVIEPLHPDRQGFEATLVREMRSGDGSEQIWDSLRRIRYHAVAPNLIAAEMETDGGRRCLLHAARAISATESAHYWLVALSEGFDEYSLSEAIESERHVYAEDRRVVSSVRPPELPLSADAGINTLADSFTLAYRGAFREFVEQALAAPSAR